MGEGQGAILKRKLIEVALPLEAINREAARDGAKRKNHPWRLHYWWARRKLAIARAVLFAQLVDDPGSCEDRFPTEETQKTERERLHGIIERLVVWENVRDRELLAEAREAILQSTDGQPPQILDPFAGGGSIPLEAQRLGLEARASDLNPVAVLINKALIEIPPKFVDRPPVFPGLAASEMASWNGAEGLAADVRAYGEWMRKEAESRIGQHYPKATLPDGTKATAIAWIWARMVTCPNPACGIQIPLVKSWWLGQKKGKEAYIVPRVVGDAQYPGGKRVEFEIGSDTSGPSVPPTKTRQGAACLSCGASISQAEIRTQAQSEGLASTQIAIIAEGNRRRAYLPPDTEHVAAASVEMPDDVPTELVPTHNHDVDRLPMYGMRRWCDAFTNRQLLALVTFSDLVAEARDRVCSDAVKSGMPLGMGLESGGTDAAAYADAVATYLGLSVSRGSDYMSNITTWHAKNEQIRTVFARQAIPMAWDFLETNFLATGSGTWASQVGLAAEALEGLQVDVPAVAVQEPAQKAAGSGALISTDPPYYDNVGYSDLSDFFYVWLRRSLRDVHSQLLSTVLVPKSEELVANPYRHEGAGAAKKFFEEGFREVFAQARKSALPNFPVTVYYAFKQTDLGDDGEVSTGWETLLDGLVRSGWAITATWPFRTETSSRMLAQGTNALASAIVLALRPRPDDAPTTDRRGLISALQEEIPGALRELQHGAIAPVDLPQAAIGPGMAVFSRYSNVIEADGSQMSVRVALARINEILDQVLNEQEGDFDSETRFAIAWYRQHGYGTGAFGDANNIANARNTSVETLARGGILASAAGKVTLFSPKALPADYDPVLDEQISVWEVLHHMISALERGGIAEAAGLLAAAGSRTETPVDADLVKELAFLLFSLSEKNGWTQDALAFNTLATSWPEIIDAARYRSSVQVEQGSFDLSDDDADSEE